MFELSEGGLAFPGRPCSLPGFLCSIGTDWTAEIDGCSVCSGAYLPPSSTAVPDDVNSPLEGAIPLHCHVFDLLSRRCQKLFVYWITSFLATCSFSEFGWFLELLCQSELSLVSMCFTHRLFTLEVWGGCTLSCGDCQMTDSRVVVLNNWHKKTLAGRRMLPLHVSKPLLVFKIFLDTNGIGKFA